MHSPQTTIPAALHALLASNSSFCTSFIPVNCLGGIVKHKQHVVGGCILFTSMVVVVVAVQVTGQTMGKTCSWHASTPSWLFLGSKVLVVHATLQDCDRYQSAPWDEVCDFIEQLDE
jgi:hypothetical protein